MKVCHVQRSLHTVKKRAKNWLYVQEVCNGNYHLLIHIRFISNREYIQFPRQLYHILVDRLTVIPSMKLNYNSSTLLVSQ